MPVIPFPSERGFNSATFMCRHIVLTTIINVSNLHLKNQKKLFIYLFSISLTNCDIPVILLLLLLLLLIISVTHSTCGVLCTVVGGVCAAASTILAVAIAKFRS